MHIPTLIARKREGEELPAEDIRRLIAGYTAGEVPDYQMSAFAMAVLFKGMTAAETVALTRAMMESGERFRHPKNHPPVVDKHSTGGIGDKVSLVLAPLVACTGCCNNATYLRKIRRQMRKLAFGVLLVAICKPGA